MQKKFTDEEMKVMQRAFSKDKTQGNNDSNETDVIAAAKANADATGVPAEKEIKSKQNNNTTSINTSKNTIAENKKQNDVKSFTKNEMQVMQRAFSKDKTQANSDSNETAPLAASKTNSNATEINTTKNAIADNKKQNDVKSFSKNELQVMQRAFSKDKTQANSDSNEIAPLAVVKTNSNATETNTTKNATANNKKQNDVKSFTKNELQVMQRAFSKDKTQANSNSNEIAPLAASNTNSNPTEINTTKNAIADNKKQNDVKSFTKNELQVMQRAFLKDKTQANSDSNEIAPLAASNTNSNATEINTTKNAIANNKKQNDVKSFTKEDVQRTIAKDKTQSSVVLNETAPLAVSKTNTNATGVAAVKELKSKPNNNTTVANTTKNATTDNKKQNDVKSFSKEDVQRSIAKDKTQSSVVLNETAPVAAAKTNTNATGVTGVKELKSKPDNNTTVANTTKNATADNKKQNDVKSLTKEDVQRTVTKDKTQTSAAPNETAPVAAAKTNNNSTGVAAVKEAQSKQNDKKLAINSVKNTATSSSAKAPAKEANIKLAATNASKSSLSKQNTVKNNSNASEKSSTKQNTKNTIIPEKGNTTNPKTVDKQKVASATNSKEDLAKGTSETNKKSVPASENIKISTATIVETKEKKQNASGIEQIKIRVLNLKESYPTNKSHTLIIEIENGENSTSNLKLIAELPRNWSLISISDIGVLEANQKKMVLISFNIPVDNPSGNTAATFIVKNLNGSKIGSKEVVFNIEPNLDLEVYNLYTSEKVQAGEMITAKYEIKNRGNVEQEISLSSTNTIKGGKLMKLGPNMTATVELMQKTDAKYYDFTTITTSLNAMSVTSGKSYKAYGSTKVFPTKLKQADPFFRYPLRFSVNYNSNTFQDEHYSTISGELIGDGFLDLKRKNYLNLIIRAPQQKNLKNFGITDQYSLIYKYNNNTTVYLGDHAYYINRLGFDSRFGMGFRVDQNINNWTLSAFFTKPRLYSFNSEALFGFKSVYRFNKNALLGFAVESSKGTVMGANKNIEANLDEKGQIGTANFELRSKNTFINAESSLSVTNKHTDQAHFVTLVQKMKDLTYSGSFTFSGENYFGIIRNSIEYSNSLSYKFRKFDFVVGQTLSEVNKRLNPLFFAAEPYFENYFGRIGYRFGPKSYIDIRVDRRIREDQLEPKSYFYKESGIDYRYIFSGRTFAFGFTGRIAETQNLLSNDLQYRTTYSHNLDASYRFSNHFSLRSGINHNYSNRYNDRNANENFYTYSVGIDYNFNRNFRFNTTYNSGFSPEDTYLRRDFINAMLMVTLAKNHLFEIRANYFENPGVTNKKELLAFGTYTYSFGVPIKRILEQGGVNGLIQVNDKSIDVKGIKIIAAGKSIVTNAKGVFELNNLPLGKNYILMDESTLPFGIIPATKTPFQVTVEKDKKAELNITIVRASSIIGTLVFPELSRPNGNNLEGYLKIENENFTYNVESNAQGVFKFQNIVPGTYKLKLTRYKGKEFFEIEKETQITVKEGQKITINVPVKGKERKVQFKSKNFTIGS
ncbi:hypothetical protein [Flavobacterium sp. SOK18b]|uniref:hypothetical protein n=1 Tax=Flavobacterium sp. SOK18b TaxID=797900 RepID=UPI001C7199B9|nr:hypothetical protein [Flavobacterium sp. SOK18b]